MSIQDDVNNFGSCNTASDLLILSAQIKADTPNRVISVPTVDDLPDLKLDKVDPGTIFYVESLKVPVIAQIGCWTGLDNRELRLDFNAGSTWAWGSNGSGRLGDNTVTTRLSPVSVVGGFSDWCEASAGISHSLAVRSNGTLWAWGYNRYGKLGDNSVTNRSSPVLVVGGFSDWCEASAGGVHSLAVRNDGTLWAWGYNGFPGLLGSDQVALKAQMTAAQVRGGFSDWCQVAGNYYSTFGVRGNGTLWSWGDNLYGCLAAGLESDARVGSPVSVVGGFSDWIQVSTKSFRPHMLGLRANGTIWSWGCNRFGELGDGTTSDRSSPVSVVGGFSDWCEVSAGYSHSLGLRTNGTLWAWGSNNRGQIGDNTITNRSSPVSVVGGFTDWCQASAGESHSLAVRSNGTLWAWGCNTTGQLGDNTITSRSSPVSVVGGFSDWCQASAGGFHSLAVRTNGTLWAWGYNRYGKLGDNSVTDRSSPVSVVGGLSDWCEASAGYSHNFAIRCDGSVWAWGCNGFGRLGDLTCVNRSSPVSITQANCWFRLHAAYNNSFAVTCDGGLFAWGYNRYGNLGLGDISARSPVSVVGGFSDWCQVSAGSYHSLAVRSNGTLWAWGCNTSGQLGDNSITGRSSPVSVVGGFSDWCQASAGYHSLAVRSNGTLWAWGSNNQGRLGDGTTTDRSSPVSIVGGFSDWCQASAGGSHSLAVRTNGTLWAWGSNSGRLGDNAIANSSSPVSVVGGFSDWCQASAGSSHSLAVRTNGTAWAWGSNINGRLGDNTTTNRSSPVSVVGGFSDWCQASAGGAHSLAIRNC
jgi:alpha-tubulin suppressor-like RCC1 family protein